MTGAQEPENLSTTPRRIADLARRHPERAFTALAHHLDKRWLMATWARTRKDGAPGIDGCDAERFAEALDANLGELLKRAKAGTFRAPAVRRVPIPKGDGKHTRPIGIPTLADKVLQRAVAMLLEPIHERDFVDGSHGFRPGRSAHQALAALHTSSHEEPDASIAQVRLCGGPVRATGWSTRPIKHPVHSRALEGSGRDHWGTDGLGFGCYLPYTDGFVGIAGCEEPRKPARRLPGLLAERLGLALNERRSQIARVAGGGRRGR